LHRARRRGRAIQALDLEQTLRGFGCAVLGPVATGGEALGLLRGMARSLRLIRAHRAYLRLQLAADEGEPR